jgi:hypothetical protein
MSGPVPDLIIPVYLNQRLVFDLVAMLQGGIATVTRVSEVQRESDKTAAQMTGGFGLSQALSSLLKVNLSGRLTGETGTSAERTDTAERVHTPASLLFTLRSLLVEKGVLHPDSPRDLPSPGEFVEFRATLTRNPLIEGLDSVVELLDLIVAFTEPTKGQHGGGKKGSTPDPTDPRRVRSQLDSLAKSLKGGGTRDLLATLVPGGERALLTVEEQFLNDPSLSDLVDGTFRVVGKVIQLVRDAEGSISLLRKAAMSRMPPQVMEALTGAFAGLTRQHGFTMPTMDTEIRGPVFHVLPIAIFA